MILYSLEVKTVAPPLQLYQLKFLRTVAFFLFYSLVNSRRYFNLPVPLHKPNQTLVYDPRMDEIHYAIDGYILHPELQSYPYDVALGAG